MLKDLILSKEERDNIRNTKEFSYTNRIWNDLHLNSRRNIGALMFLIKNSKATTIEEWAKYYFTTGRDRANIITRLNTFENKNKPIDFRIIDSEYGRTLHDFSKIAKTLVEKLNISFELALNYVYIRVIDETWVGYNRELIVFNKLKDLLKNSDIEVRQVDYQKDVEFAIDYELVRDKEVILGIQLKSTNYKESGHGKLTDCKIMNIEKNIRYSDVFDAYVVYLYISSDDEIINISSLEKLFCLKVS